jgi:hypothetical protein
MMQLRLEPPPAGPVSPLPSASTGKEDSVSVSGSEAKELKESINVLRGR